MIKITIDVLDSGYVMTRDTVRCAYSNLDDLLMGLGEMLGPVPQMTIGVDMAAPGSERHVEWSIETLDDDGWRVWEGGLHAKAYPPGVKDDTTVLVRYRNGQSDTARKAVRLRWTHHDSGSDPAWDIVGYRVVKP